MSQENVEVVRRLVAAVNARDFEGYLACCGEDVELHLPGVGQLYEGPEGIKRWFADIEDAGPDFHLDIRDVSATSDNQVLAFLRATSTGRASGVPVTAESTNIYDLIDGKARRIRIFLERDAALKAVGLEEWAVSEESTAPDLVEHVRAILEAADRADFDSILAFYAPDAVWELRAGGTFKGTEAIRGLWQDYYGAFEDFHLEIEQVRDLGGGVVLAVNQQQGRPVGASRAVQAREAFVYEWQRGTVVRVTMYADVDEARAAAERLAQERR